MDLTVFEKIESQTSNGDKRALLHVMESIDGDFEIAVVDSKRRFGNGYCIPAGPLREAQSRLDSVDIIVEHETGTVISAHHETAGFVLEFGVPFNIISGETRTLETLGASTVHAVAGIGDPRRFFNQLRDCGMDIIEHPFPEHYRYHLSDLSFGGAAIIIMTEKDAVKCADLGLDNIWAIPVTATMSESLKSRFSVGVKKLKKF